MIVAFRFLKPRKEKKDESWRDAFAAFVIQVDIVIDNTDKSYHICSVRERSNIMRSFFGPS